MEFNEDCRIHLILFFISGSIVSYFDFMFMKKLGKLSNILPLISKV